MTCTSYVCSIAVQQLCSIALGMAITIITNNKLLITENMTIIKIVILVEMDATNKSCPRSINRFIVSRMSATRRGGSCCGFVILML